MLRLNLPNWITIGRIVLAIAIVPLLFQPAFAPRFVAFLVFLIAAFSDLWDGHLARSRNMVTDLGKLLDPLADKLLLAATFIPFYLLSHGWETAVDFPWFGGVFPLWIMLLVFGRELFITLFRSWAARRGVVIAAGPAGKFKTVFQSIFIGSTILWYALHSAALRAGWSGGFWAGWQTFHFWFSVVTLTIAVILTIYSMIVYMIGARSLFPAGSQ